MLRVRLDHELDLDGWRHAARQLVRNEVAPAAVEWRVAGSEAELFAPPAWSALPAREGAFCVPRTFLELAGETVQHSDPARFDLLYRLLWRLTHGEAGLLGFAVDPDVRRAAAMRKAVRRAAHKMTAFVRFREVAAPGRPRYVAWFEPDHHVVEGTAPFFARRFAAMRWSILTPARSAHWDGEALAFGPGARRTDAPAEDALEEHWRAYYASIFNPARLKVAAMQGEMPRKYWRNLPEASLIKPLVEDAVRRTRSMLDAAPAECRRPDARPGAPRGRAAGTSPG